jgi:hypothetical protein
LPPKRAGKVTPIPPELAAPLVVAALATDSVLLIDWRRSSIGRRTHAAAHWLEALVACARRERQRGCANQPSQPNRKAAGRRRAGA